MTTETLPSTDQEPRHVLKRVGRFLGDAIMNLLAVLGVVCIVLVICAFAFNITLIMFKTGSMDPTIPQGSVAVVQRVPADTVNVGDIITVDREGGKLPITHRIIATSPGPNGSTTIEMQGDANPNPDPAPYEVTEVRKVLWSVPGLANVIVRMGDPRFLAGVTLSAALLVGWAFWPRRHEDESPPPSERI